MIISNESTNSTNQTFEQDFLFMDLPMKREASPTLRNSVDSKHKWKLTLHKQDGTKLIRFASTKKHALAVGQSIHNAAHRPTKMFNIEKV